MEPVNSKDLGVAEFSGLSTLGTNPVREFSNWLKINDDVIVIDVQHSVVDMPRGFHQHIFVLYRRNR